VPGTDDADPHLLAVGCIDNACSERQDTEGGCHTGHLEHIPATKIRSAVHFHMDLLMDPQAFSVTSRGIDSVRLGRESLGNLSPGAQTGPPTLSRG
jgi:hypothetical protein